MKICAVQDCGRKHFGLSFCSSHYRRFKLYGDPKTGIRTFRGSGLDWIKQHKNHDSDECLPWPFGRKGAYGEVTLDGKPMRASRAMCLMAHGKPPTEKPEAAHSCGNAICANPRHLRWASPAENTSDKWAHGTMLVGEQCNGAKLTTAEILKIRRLSGRLTQKKIGERFGVSQPNISAIVNQKRWKHI